MPHIFCSFGSSLTIRNKKTQGPGLKKAKPTLKKQNNNQKNPHWIERQEYSFAGINYIKLGSIPTWNRVSRVKFSEHLQFTVVDWAQVEHGDPLLSPV